MGQGGVNSDEGTNGYVYVHICIILKRRVHEPEATRTGDHVTQYTP